MHQINGYCILRKPEHNYEDNPEFISTGDAPQINGVYYSGLDRMPWADISLEYHLGNLDNEGNRRFLEIDKSQVCLFVELTQSYEDAVWALGVTNTSREKNEISVIYSDSNQLFTSKAIQTDISIQWLGWDVFTRSFGSQIRGGIFYHPDAFEDFADLLNVHGLLEGVAVCEQYISKYMERQSEACIEPLPGFSINDTAIVRIGRVTTQL